MHTYVQGNAKFISREENYVYLHQGGFVIFGYCLKAILWKSYWMDLYEIFIKGSTVLVLLVIHIQ